MMIDSNKLEQNSTIGEIIGENPENYFDVLLSDIQIEYKHIFRKEAIKNLKALLELKISDLAKMLGCEVVDTSQFINDIDDLISNNQLVYTIVDDATINVSLAQRFKLEPRQYEGIRIKNAGLSNRLTNCLLRNGYSLLENVVEESYCKIAVLAGYGKLCKNELFRFLNSIKKGNNIDTFSKDNEEVFKRIIRNNYDLLLAGRFDEIDKSQFTDENIIRFDKLREAYSIIDIEIIEKCIYKPEDTVKYIGYLQHWADQLANNTLLDKEIGKIKERRLHSPARCFLEAFSLYDSINGDITLLEYIYSNRSKKKIIDFVKFCQFDLSNDAEKWAREIEKKNSYVTIIKERSSRKTLGQVGNNLGVTRERVRQIESRVLRLSANWIRKEHIIPKLLAELGGSLTAYSDQVSEMFGQYGQYICYALRKLDDEIDTYFFDKSLDMFVFGDNNEDLTTQARSFCNTLPDQFDEGVFEKYIEEGVRETSVPETIIREVLNKEYKVTSGVYHRSILRLTDIYRIILEKYYPDGIWVYGDEEIEEFKRHITENFDGVELYSNHAIISGIGRIAILCGRGMYRSKKSQYISEELKEKIEGYIDDNQRDIILYNTIFFEFEDELKDEGIDNRYYMQGVLREVFGDKYYFKKDYISKTGETGSISKDIVEYVRESKAPVTIKEIMNAFPGVTQIVIGYALQDSSIIKFFWSYVHANNLDIYESDKKYLKDRLDELLSDGVPHHDSELFAVLDKDRHDILARIGVLYPYNLYSVIEHYFGEYYSFARPYIAKMNVEINHPKEAIDDFIANTEYFEIGELQEVAKQYHYQIPSILSLMESYFNTHILIDHDHMGSIEYSGVSENTCREIEKLFEGHISETVMISNLGSIGVYPRINVPWNEWLIYCIIQKWSSIYEVGVIGTIYNNYTPIIAKRGMLKEIEINNEDATTFETIVDLDNIDDLLLDVIEDTDLDDI